MEALIGSDGLLNSILQIGGSTVPARTRFIASTIATTTYSSLTFGLFSGLVGAITPFGPLVPFLSGCWMGYSLGLYSVWRSAKSLAVRCAERYPRLLAHTLELEFELMVPRDCVDFPPIKTAGSTPIYNAEEETSLYQWQSGREDFVNSSSHPFAQWICNGGIGRLSWAILAAQECQRTMYDIERDQIEKIVDANYRNAD
ncbi:hypothetical protein HJC23_005284 [Cyclotella cryptica]|uniref:Uncharacterized protein n=1 Tax=Cyclotella cryptica TaxID=29204 RepID=A0ABD3P586_9STRA|eukprot:CCRYP_017741-RA/>CCRYP_017741-RA protein AED:0.02 eAED:0.02 QI:315/1/1/1/1/1/2/555/199